MGPVICPLEQHCKLKRTAPQSQKQSKSFLSTSQIRHRVFPSTPQLTFSAQYRSLSSLIHTDGGETSGRRESWQRSTSKDSSASSFTKKSFSNQQGFWDNQLQLDRSEELSNLPAAVLADKLANQKETLPQKKIVQSKLSQLLSSSDSEDDRTRDPLEEVSVEHNQAVASFGRAIYETALDSRVNSEQIPTSLTTCCGLEVLRLDPAGKFQRIFVKRRDLLRGIRLQPRDLRRIDPSLGSLTKPTPNITVKENALLVHLGGVRAILMADKCLLFDPDTVSAKKFLEVLSPRLQGDSRKRAHRTRTSYTTQGYSEEELRPPFELECLEGAFLVASGRLDCEMETATLRMAEVLNKLPKEITPVNLEELRRVKQALVELESRADQLRDMVEEIMDDEDEVRDLNLSSRPLREERRRQRDRERLERGIVGRSHHFADAQEPVSGTRSSGARPAWNSNGAQTSSSTPAAEEGSQSAPSRRESEHRHLEEAEDGYQEAEAALEEMDEAEEEEREVEEVEDLLEYYLQRAAATQSEAERLLDGARDLEESIGVSLSARRFEVNRLELTLSIGSFAAGLGAMIAGIFGMNLTSTFESSVIGFWGTTALIVLGCIWICWALYSYTRRKRIL